jgi:hypothetical protein
VQTSFETKEMAAKFVEEFWRAMPHGYDIVNGPLADDFTKELTAGDRTLVVQGRIGELKGKWVVVVQGNHQPLTREAADWLKGKGLL